MPGENLDYPGYLVYIAENPESGGAVADAILGNLQTLDVADGAAVLDVFDINGDGLALVSKANAGSGISLECPNGTSGIVLLAQFPVGDCVKAGIITGQGSAIAASNQGIDVGVGFVADGLGATPDSSGAWHGLQLEITGQIDSASGIYELTSGAPGVRWTTSAVSATFDWRGWEARFAFERIGTTLNVYLLSSSNAKQLITTETVTTGAGDIVVRCVTNFTGKSATVRMAGSVAFEGDLLVVGA